MPSRQPAPIGSLPRRALAARARPWLALAGAALIVAAIVPPAGTYARQYAWVQALQFVIFAAAAPLLLVLGAPQRTSQARPGPDQAAPPAGPGHAAGRAIARLAAFIVVVVAWRLPGVLSALARNPALIVAEMSTLVAAGAGVWLELAAPARSAPRLAPPPRAGLAAVSMWTIWVVAYIAGMSPASWPGASGRAAARGLSPAADQQIAVAILWAGPAICFAPVIYALLISWLGERDDPSRELQDASSARSVPSGLPRPPRGWRSPR